MLTFDYVEYGKLNVKDSPSRGVPDWDDILYTPQLRNMGARYANTLAIKNSFYGSIGKFSFGLFSSRTNVLSFVAIQQRNEEEISRGGRSFHHMRFTILQSENIIQNFQELNAVYATLSNIFKIQNHQYEYRFPERTEIRQVDDSISLPEIACNLSPEPISRKNALFWLDQPEWSVRIAFWLLLLSKKQPVVITYRANDPELTLSRRIQICDALSFLLSCYEMQPFFTFALDPFTGQQTDLLFEPGESNYRNIEDDKAKIIAEILLGYFSDKGLFAADNYKGRIVLPNNNIELAFTRWKNTIAEILKSDSMSIDSTFLNFLSFRGLYTRDGLIESLLVLFHSNISNWISIVRDVLINISDWLHGNLNNNIKETIQKLLSDSKIQGETKITHDLVVLYWNILDKRRGEPNGHIIDSDKYTTILNQLDLFEIPEIVEIMKETEFHFPVDLPEHWKLYFIELIEKQHLVNLRSHLERQEHPWNIVYKKYLRQINDSRYSDFIEGVELLDFAGNQQLSWYKEQNIQKLEALRSNSLHHLSKETARIFFNSSIALTKQRKALIPINDDIKLKELIKYSLDTVIFFDHMTLYELPLSQKWFHSQLLDKARDTQSLYTAKIISLFEIQDPNSICETITKLNLDENISEFLITNLIRSYAANNRSIGNPDIEYMLENSSEFTKTDFNNLRNTLPRATLPLDLFFRLFDKLTHDTTQNSIEIYMQALSQYPLSQILRELNTRTGDIINRLKKELINERHWTDVIGLIQIFSFEDQLLVWQKYQKLEHIKFYIRENCSKLLEPVWLAIVRNYNEDYELGLIILESNLYPIMIRQWLDAFNGDRNIVIRDSKSGKQLQRLYGHPDWIRQYREPIFKKLATIETDITFLQKHVIQHPEDIKYILDNQLEQIISLYPPEFDYASAIARDILRRNKVSKYYETYKHSPSHAIFIEELVKIDRSITPISTGLEDYRSILIITFVIVIIIGIVILLVLTKL